jgi:hypothetical protein
MSDEYARDESEAASSKRHIDTTLVPRITLLENVAEAVLWYMRTARQLQVPGTPDDARRIVDEMNEALALMVVSLERAGYSV